MVKAFAYDKKTNLCIMKMKDVVRFQERETTIELEDKSGTVIQIEKKPYKIRIYHN